MTKIVMIIENKNVRTLNRTFTKQKSHIQVKLVYNDHPWDPKIEAVINRWSMFKGHLCFRIRPKNGGRCWQAVVSSGLTVHNL